MSSLKFPIGISTLAKLREEGYCYVDKTQFVEKLTQQGAYYFLSRPRRFGKSLMLDTIKQAFLGNKKAFEGLYLENHWDWSKKYPVIHISFASNQVTQATDILETKIADLLQSVAADYQLTLRGELCSSQFLFLIHDLYKKYHQRVVILIDEYDKPILDVITDTALARDMRDILRSLYSVIKDNDDKIQFVLLTGVSKFSKAGVFSGLNNLNDITYDEKYATICGYTQAELEHTFAPLLTKEDLPKIKEWYNGYYFLGNEGVYNPFSILNYFAKGKHFSNYWFSTGTPTFLTELCRQQHFYIPDLENIVINEDDLESFDIEELPVVVLLLQTGYLTIHEVLQEGMITSYQLGYPNVEVRLSLNHRLAEFGVNKVVKNKMFQSIRRALSERQFEKLKDILTSLFASIPHDWYRNNNIQHYEGFYCATVYAYFIGLGYTAIAEDVTSQGQIDLTILMDSSIVIMEFKLTKHGDAQSALQQIKDRKYADKYIAYKKPIYLLGLSFDVEHRNIEECVFELHT